MSVVAVQEHSESIYELKKKPPEPVNKPVRYTSRYRGQVREEVQRNKGGHRTFGLAEIGLVKTSEFLKKHSRVQPQPVVASRCCLAEGRRPPLPAPLPPPPPRGEQGETRDFRRQNALAVARATPRLPLRRIADTRHGERRTLHASGLEPCYLLRQDYGKKPAYLMRRLKSPSKDHQQSDIASSSDLPPNTSQEKDKDKDADVTVSSKANKRSKGKRGNDDMVVAKAPVPREVPAEERAELLAGLQRNWQRLQKGYELLPVLVDNASKARRKLALEAELKQIEHDIRMIERHPVIFVQP